MNIPRRRLSITKESVNFMNIIKNGIGGWRIGDSIKKVLNLYLNDLDALRNRLKTI